MACIMAHASAASYASSGDTPDTGITPMTHDTTATALYIALQARVSGGLGGSSGW
jgi:hypothetical protein